MSRLIEPALQQQLLKRFLSRMVFSLPQYLQQQLKLKLLLTLSAGAV